MHLSIISRASHISYLLLILVQRLKELLSRPLRLLLLTLEALVTQSLLLERCGIRIQSQHDHTVLQRVLLLHMCPLCRSITLWLAKHGLHFGRVDQACDVGIADEVRGEQEVLLQKRGGGCAAVDAVEGLEGR